MTKRLLIRLVLLVMIGVLAVGPAVLTTRAGEVNLNGARWAQTKTPFPLRVGNNLTNRWNGHLDRSVRDWRKSGVVRFQVVDSQSGSRKNCKPRNGQVEICSARYGQNGWLGLSRIWIDGSNHIVRATIMLNDTYFLDDPYYKNQPKARQHTMCHELGHVIGLDHNTKKSCLNDSNASVFRDVKPSQQDFNRLKRLYKRRDNRAAVESAQAPGGAVESAAAPPLPSAGASGAGESVQVQSLGGGARVVTYITWIDE